MKIINFLQFICLNNFRNYFIFIIIFIFFSCASGFRTKKLLHATTNSAFYELARKELSYNQFLEGKLRHPYKITSEKLKDILGNLEFVKNTRINQYSDYVFHATELDKFTIDLALTLEKLKDTHVGVVIIQHDTERSVISYPKRTSFLIFINEEGLNIVFGDIQQMVSREISYNFFDWTQISPIGLKENPDENEIILVEELFQFKKVKGYYNRKWLVFSLNDLDKYKFQPREIDKKNLEN